jgi:hypothetical protein
MALRQMDNAPSRLLKNPLSLRLLKKVQMQGGAPGTRPQDGCRREAYLRVRRSAARERGVPIREMGPRRWAFFSSLLRQSNTTVPGREAVLDAMNVPM